jgi:hypothetical protein
VADLDGPEHCEWQAMRAIVVSEPVGRRTRGYETARHDVRDPENVLDDAVTAERLDVEAELPGSATDTGPAPPHDRDVGRFRRSGLDLRPRRGRDRALAPRPGRARLRLGFAGDACRF